MQLREIPIDEIDGIASRPNSFWDSQVVAHRNPPRRLDHRGRAGEKVVCRDLICRKRLFKRRGLKSRNRHSLTVRRIEAANRIATYQKTFRKTIDVFISMTRACGKPRRVPVADRLRTADHFINVL